MPEQMGTADQRRKAALLYAVRNASPAAVRALIAVALDLGLDLPGLPLAGEPPLVVADLDPERHEEVRVCG